MSLYQFIIDLDRFAKEIYRNDDSDHLNIVLQELNVAYDELMISREITTMEREYVLSKYIKLDEVNMFNVPVIKRMSMMVMDRYNKYHCIDNGGDMLSPMN